MAKSLRSKWKRKMKAVKRVRYGEKVCNFIEMCSVVARRKIANSYFSRKRLC